MHKWAEPSSNGGGGGVSGVGGGTPWLTRPLSRHLTGSTSVIAPPVGVLFAKPRWVGGPQLRLERHHQTV